jgi:DNA-binding NtrC family response regulator
MQSSPAGLREIEITDPPPTRKSGRVRTVHIGGAVLTIGLERTRRNELQRRLIELGLMAYCTLSEVTALELLYKGGIFDVIVLELPEEDESRLHIIKQIRARSQNVAIVAISRDEDAATSLRCMRDPKLRAVDAEEPTQTVAEMVCEIVRERRGGNPCLTGAIPVGPSSLSQANEL